MQDIVAGSKGSSTLFHIDAPLPMPWTIFVIDGVITSYSIHYTKLYEALIRNSLATVKQKPGTSLNKNHMVALPFCPVCSSFSFRSDIVKDIVRNNFV